MVVNVSQLDIRLVSILLFEISQGATVTIPIMFIVLSINITRILNMTEIKISIKYKLISMLMSYNFTNQNSIS